MKNNYFNLFDPPRGRPVCDNVELSVYKKTAENFFTGQTDAPYAPPS
jgi:hypothetical protein